MTELLKPHLLLSTIQHAAVNLRVAGWICFCVQVFLAIISGLVLAFAVVDPNFNLKAGNPFSSSGLFFACIGLTTLGLGSYWAFRYTRIAKSLQLSNGVVHLTKVEVIQFLWQGLVINAVGMFLNLLGVEAIAAALLAKSLTQVQGLAIYNNNQLIQSLDILVVQANVNTIFVQFIGIIVSAWLISRINHHS
ncbi:MAG: DUF3611 family protein [Plectolyngbya sp. WJT66-NPBG17]|jgi:hypothetical protein|nr:DUF3611 family protein [Plectolyngbya sp. WJT66-NPBG17]